MSNNLPCITAFPHAPNVHFLEDNRSQESLHMLQEYQLLLMHYIRNNN